MAQATAGHGPGGREILVNPACTSINCHTRGARCTRPRQDTAESVLTPRHPTGRLPAETAARSTITQIYEGTNQIQRVVMARQLLKG